MRKYWLGAAALALAMLLAGCCMKHEAVIDAAVAPSCTKEGLTEGAHCGKCGEVFYSQQVVPMLAHTPETDAAIAATCTTDGLTEGSHCAVCGYVIQQQQIVAALGHSEEVVVPGFQATCLKWGATDRTACSVCGEALQGHQFLEAIGHHYVDGVCTHCKDVEVDYSDLSIYISHEGDQFFATAKHGQQMRMMYDELDEKMLRFHTDKTVDAELMDVDGVSGLYEVGEFNFAQYGLTQEEAATVFALYRKDHPVFYWMTDRLLGNEETIFITTTEEFAHGADRVSNNELVYAGVAEIAHLADGETSAYNIAMIFYEEILIRETYATDENGIPEDGQWAHSILGAFTEGRVVCEGYAKLFQMLLTAKGIENMHIVGTLEGTPHSWNAVKLEDGYWHWFDLTAGDINGEAGYEPHDFFCQCDDAFVSYVPTAAGELGIYFNTEVPHCTEEFHEAHVVNIHEKVDIDGNRFELVHFGVFHQVGGVHTDVKMVVYDGAVYWVEQ